MKKTQEIFERTEDNTIYILMKATGIHFMVAGFDGLQITRFDGNKTPYLLFTQTIAWFEKEIDLGADRDGKKSEMLHTLRRIEKDFARQLAEETPQTVEMGNNTAQGTNGKQKRA